MSSHQPILEVKHLKKYFPIRKGVIPHIVGHVKAVDDISFTVPKGKTVGLVGESGCGKTTAGRTVLRLIEPTSGEILFNGYDFRKITHATALRRLRQQMQIIFQDPYSSLNPRLTVFEIIGEALKLHGLVQNRTQQREVVSDLLVRVGLSPSYINRYPHEFSGGQRQRIGIARALALKPSFIVCDEAVSALDVSVQAQILNLLKELQDELNFSYLFIAHDLGVVKHISDVVAVMYLGKIVEISPVDDIFNHPLHPYTQALLSAMPIPKPNVRRERIILEGDVPSPINPPSGCRFRTRCPLVKDQCLQEEPPLKVTSKGHEVACFRIDESSKQAEKIAQSILIASGKSKSA